MKNYWVTRRVKRKAIGEINKSLMQFIGEDYSPVSELVLKLRKSVLAYFQQNKEYAKHFLSDRSVSRIDYRFDIEKRMGKVSSIEFKEIEH